MPGLELTLPSHSLVARPALRCVGGPIDIHALLRPRYGILELIKRFEGGPHRVADAIAVAGVLRSAEESEAESECSEEFIGEHR